jgi:phosphohistidine phosphatase
MKNLILIRHAKSTQEFSSSDKLRKIINHGFLDSQSIAQKCIDFLPKMFSVWSSAATRTTQTSVIFAQNCFFSIDDIIYRDDLYTFDENQLTKIIKSCNDDVKNLIIFGHNSAITDFVNKFGDIYINNVPTSGFVSINFETQNWATISKGKTIKTIFPKD